MLIAPVIWKQSTLNDASSTVTPHHLAFIKWNSSTYGSECGCHSFILMDLHSPLIFPSPLWKENPEKMYNV